MEQSERVHPWAALPTLVRYQVKRFLSIWINTLVPSAISLILYLLIFGTLIGERVGPIRGVSYMEFIVPGLIMLTVVMSAYENVTFSLYMAKFEHCIEEMLVAPIPLYVILTGYVIGGVARGLVIAAIAMVICSLFGAFSIAHPLVLALTIVLASALFSMAGFINALFANNFDDVSIIPVFVLTPLIYLGGVFYSVQMLPDFWRHLSQLNPLLYIINAARYGFTGIVEVNLTAAFTMMVFFILVLAAVCLYLLERGVGLRN